MKIGRVVIHSLSLPLAQPLKPRSTTSARWTRCVEMPGAGGAIAWLLLRSSAPRPALQALARTWPRSTRREPPHARAVRSRVALAQLPWPRRRGGDALAALDTACWDLAAAIGRLRLWRFHGAERHRVPAYASSARAAPLDRRAGAEAQRFIARATAR